MNYLERIDDAVAQGELAPDLASCLYDFYLSYQAAIESQNADMIAVLPLLNQFLTFVIEEIKEPSLFEAYHRRILEPFNYHLFGLNFIRPLVRFEESSLHHPERLDEIAALLAKGENVVLLANHQTEPDPQVIGLMLEKTHPKIAEEMIFMAGHRVITDPLAIPFSKGCNLLCVFSKKYIETPPEKKAGKLAHNQNTLQKMASLLKEGGKCIYVAPSGGRDRANSAGIVEMAPFDPQSIEMLRLIAKQAKTTTHFFPLALATYHILPPPAAIRNLLGESRRARAVPVHLAFGKRIEMEKFPISMEGDKHAIRRERAEYIWKLVFEEYKCLQ